MMTINKSPGLAKAARRSRNQTAQAGGLIGKGALLATHAALTMARGAVAEADTAVKKYLPAGGESGRVARRVEKAPAKVKRKMRRAAGKAKRTAKSAAKVSKRRAAKRGRR